jgi:hypothetical protein
MDELNIAIIATKVNEYDGSNKMRETGRYSIFTPASLITFRHLMSSAAM